VELKGRGGEISVASLNNRLYLLSYQAILRDKIQIVCHPKNLPLKSRAKTITTLTLLKRSKITKKTRSQVTMSQLNRRILSSNSL
jgi:hypothetical protein